MLDDHHRRVVEPVDQAPGRLRVVEVQVRQLLAAELHRVVPPAPPAGQPVAGRPLVRVLAVAQLLDPLERQGEGRRQGVGRGIEPVEPRDDRRVVGRGAGERRPGQAPAGLVAQAAGGAQLVEHRPVLLGIDHDTDVGVVLRRGPDHGRPTHVDELDARRGRERVEVDDGQADRLEAELGQLGPVLGLVEVGQQAGVDGGVQRDHAVTEDGRVAGEVRDIGHRQPGVADRLRRAPARDQAPAQLVQAGRQLRDARLVVDRQQRGGRRHRRNPSMISG